MKPTTDISETITDAPTEQKKTLTKWEILDESAIVPIRLACQDYRGVDTSCHTGLPLQANSVLRHIAPEHGSQCGFEIHLRYRDGAKTNFWKELSAAGIELHDFVCDICGEQMVLNPRKIIKHTQAHSGKQRGPKPGGKFWMTLNLGMPQEGDDSWEED